MKRMVKHVLLSVLLVVLLLSFAACGDEPPTPDPVPTPLTDVVIFKDGVNANGYTIIYPEGDPDAMIMAVDIGNICESVTGVSFEPKSDESIPAGAYEILVGKTNRPVSQTLAAEVDAMSEESKWGFRIDGSSLAIYAVGDFAQDRCCSYLQNTLIVDGKDLVLSNTYAYTDRIAAEALEALRAEETAKIEAAIQTLSTAIVQLPIENFYGSTRRYSWDSVKDQVAATGTYAKEYDKTTIENMTLALNAQSYSAPSAENSPTVGQHPRLLFTAEDIPAIKTAMADPACAEIVKAFYEYREYQTDGKLPALTYVEPVNHRDVNGISYYSNYDTDIAASIQAKAFYYAITGEEMYGYQALYAYFNFIDTFDVGYCITDQCRYYGYVAYIGALVYDWCYDLMDAATREKLILGIQNTCYVGYSSLPDGHKGSGAKTEVGFPPTGGEGPVEGHGCERELLCEYLAVAIAIYDEHPDWYELVGGRIFAQYMPVREKFYDDAGIYPGGSGNYATFRYPADEMCAWLLTVALGENPFSPNMQKVARSLVAHTLTLEDGVFTTGDTIRTTVNTFYVTSLLSSYLFDDPYMRDYCKDWYAAGAVFSEGGPEVGGLMVAELLLCAIKGTETEDYRKGLDLVTYNGGFYQQIIARNNWTDDSPIVLLRGASATTVDHTHLAAGEFEIYYKGRLSIGDGVYTTFGSNHHAYYHQATIAHSCVLVYNPGRKNRYNGYYCGGQSRPTPMGTTQFMTGTYSVGEVLGVKYGYDSTGNAKYVYYANDLSKGYEYDNDVDYVGRTIVTTFPEGNYPMVMFIYDRIDVPKTNYIKTFLLQCTKEPVLDTTNLTAVVDNGTGGCMVLKNVYGGADIAAYGSESEAGEQRFWISTQQKNLPSDGNRTNMLTWGKVEIRTPAGNNSDVMVNVVYVTDSANKSNMLATEQLVGTGYYGARAAGQTAIFAFGTDGKSYARNAITFTAAGSGTQDYYIGGLATGTWQVSIGGQSLGNMTVADGEHVLVFSSEHTGNVTVTPVILAN